MEKIKYTSLATMVALFLSMLTLSSTMEMFVKSNEVGGGKPLVRSDKEILGYFEEWLQTYGKSYYESEEKMRRLKIFKDNLKYIEEHNRPENNYPFNLGLNQFADLTDDEFKSIYLNDVDISGMSSPPINGSSPIQIRYDLPEYINWAERGLVNPVRDQGTCASGWAFSAAGAVEAINKWITDELVDLSEQQLVDCDKRNKGCSGGEIAEAFAFIYANGGLVTEDAYPYVGKKEPWQQCDSRRTWYPIAPIVGFEPVFHEDYLPNALANQPVSVTVDASSPDFRFYRSGIFTGKCGYNVNHGMLAVGYAKDYWIVKNSWGTTWGENGYIRIIRKAREEIFGKCGIVKSAYYPMAEREPSMSHKSLNDIDGHNTHA